MHCTALKMTTAAIQCPNRVPSSAALTTRSALNTGIPDLHTSSMMHPGVSRLIRAGHTTEADSVQSTDPTVLQRRLVQGC
jgi:hypothetical protein